MGGASPLLVASQEGHTDVVDILIKAGADVHQATEVMTQIVAAHAPTFVKYYYNLSTVIDRL